MPLPKAEGADQFSYLRELAKSETAASVELSNVYPHRSAIMQELYLKPMRKVEPDQAKVAESRAALSASLDIYDSILSKQAYLTGSEFSLVDLFVRDWQSWPRELQLIGLLSAHPDFGISQPGRTDRSTFETPECQEMVAEHHVQAVA